jgi:hypothetical protein
MSFVLSYPVTRYKPSPIVDLCTKAERERLSPPAIKAFFKIQTRSDSDDAFKIQRTRPGRKREDPLGRPSIQLRSFLTTDLKAATPSGPSL